MTDNIIKRNQFKKLGNSLIVKGVWFVKNAFNVKPQTTTGAYLKALITARTGLTGVRLADRTYYYIDIDTVKDILKYDLVDEKKYESEKYDCDDFSQTIHAIFRYVFELNSMGTARGIEMVDLKTGKNVGWHRANIFIASDNGTIKLYYLEPQNDFIQEITSKEIIGIQGFKDKKLILRDFDF